VRGQLPNHRGETHFLDAHLDNISPPTIRGEEMHPNAEAPSTRRSGTLLLNLPASPREPMGHRQNGISTSKATHLTYNWKRSKPCCNSQTI
jgi:hypothetical protein